MKDHCRYGHFDREDRGFVSMEDVSAPYFANLEDYRRITVIPPPRRTLETHIL